MDDPSLILVGGDPLNPASARALPPGTVARLMVYQPAIRPIDVGDIVEVTPGAGRRLGDVVLCIHAGRCSLGRVIRDDRGSSVELQIGLAEVGTRSRRTPLSVSSRRSSKAI